MQDRNELMDTAHAGAAAEVHESKYPVAVPEDGVADWKSPPPVLVSVPGAVEGPTTKR